MGTSQRELRSLGAWDLGSEIWYSINILNIPFIALKGPFSRGRKVMILQRVYEECSPPINPISILWTTLLNFYFSDTDTFCGHTRFNLEQGLFKKYLPPFSPFQSLNFDTCNLFDTHELVSSIKYWDAIFVDNRSPKVMIDWSSSNIIISALVASIQLIARCLMWNRL